MKRFRVLGVWWVRYAGSDGRIRREKVGNRGDALSLYQKRKTRVLLGEKTSGKFPDRSQCYFRHWQTPALEWSKAHKLSYDDDRYRMAKIKEALGNRPAESITPQEFERWIDAHENWSPATANRYRALLSLTYRLGVQNAKGRFITRPA